MSRFSSSSISFYNYSNDISLYSQVFLQGFYIFFSTIIFLFLFLLYISNTDIIPSEFFSIQLRASVAQFLLHPSINSFLLNSCQCFHSSDVIITNLQQVYLYNGHLFCNTSLQQQCNNSGIWSFIMGILLPDLVFHNRVLLSNFFQYFTTKTSIQAIH